MTKRSKTTIRPRSPRTRAAFRPAIHCTRPSGACSATSIRSGACASTLRAAAPAAAPAIRNAASPPACRSSRRRFAKAASAWSRQNATASPSTRRSNAGPTNSPTSGPGITASRTAAARRARENDGVCLNDLEY